LPNPDQIFAALTPAVNNDRLTLTLDAPGLTNLIARPLAVSRERANRVVSQSHLKIIGLGIKLYEDQFKAYPPDLGTMAITQDVAPEDFASPSSRTQVPKDLAHASRAEQAKWINANSDFIYLGANFDAKTPADAIVAYEKPDIHGGDGMNVLFNDFHAEWLSVADAMKRIEKQKAGK
jgi:prepilin-type processing-associated H-X9-DG protein